MTFCFSHLSGILDGFQRWDRPGHTQPCALPSLTSVTSGKNYSKHSSRKMRCSSSLWQSFLLFSWAMLLQGYVGPFLLWLIKSFLACLLPFLVFSSGSETWNLIVSVGMHSLATGEVLYWISKRDILPQNDHHFLFSGNFMSCFVL